MKGKNHTEVWLMGCGSACNARLIHPMFKVFAIKILLFYSRIENSGLKPTL